MVWGEGSWCFFLCFCVVSIGSTLSIFRDISAFTHEFCGFDVFSQGFRVFSSVSVNFGGCLVVFRVLVRIFQFFRGFMCV